MRHATKVDVTIQLDYTATKNASGVEISRAVPNGAEDPSEPPAAHRAALYAFLAPHAEQAELLQNVAEWTVGEQREGQVEVACTFLDYGNEDYGTDGFTVEGTPVGSALADMLGEWLAEEIDARAMEELCERDEGARDAAIDMKIMEARGR